MGGLLPVLAALALVLQGVVLPTPRDEDQTGLMAKGPVLVLKEDRAGGSALPLLPGLPKPPPLRLDFSQGKSVPTLIWTPPGRHLYLLYRRLQLEGG